MKLIYNIDRQSIQSGFGEFRAASLVSKLRPIRGSIIPIEFYQVKDSGDFVTPVASDYSFTLDRPANPVERGILNVTWTAESEDIDLSQRNLAGRVEAAMNGISEVDAAGGVNVTEISRNRLYRIEWRADGDRALPTATISGGLVPCTATISTVEDGAASGREVQILSIQESALAEIATTDWALTASPSLSVSVTVAGTANIREVETIQITGRLADGSTFAIGNSRQIPVDAPADTIRALLNEELGAGTIRRVDRVGEYKWLVYWDVDGVVTPLAEGTSNLIRQDGLTGSLDTTTPKLAAAMRGGYSMPVIGTMKNETTGEILFAQPVIVTEPGLRIADATDGIHDTDGNLILDTDGNPI